jgi:hypothetical protein
MTQDPLRWLEDSSTNPQLVSLLSSAAAPLDLPVAVEAKLGHTLHQLATTTTKASLVASSAPKALLGFATKPLFLVGAVATTTLLAGLGIRQLTAHDATTQGNRGTVMVQTVPQGKTTASIPKEPTPNEMPSVAAKVNPLNALGDSSTPVINGKTSLTQRPATRSSPSTLAEEARLLESVRAQLSRDPGTARKALALYDAKFPKGVLKEERTLLAVKLAIAEGRANDAQAQAVTLEQSNVRSPYAETARKIVNSNERATQSRTISK